LALAARRLRLPWLGRIGTPRWLGRGSVPPDPSVSVRLATPRDPALALTDPGPGLVRDPAFLEWRYLSAPQPYELMLAERAGRPLGHAALRLHETPGGRHGLMAELRVASEQDERAAAAVAGAAAARLHSQGALVLFTLAAPRTPLHHALRRSGFWRRRRAFGVHFVPLLPGAEALAAACGPDLAGGDFDVV
jgi:hypothetical protein